MKNILIPGFILMLVAMGCDDSPAAGHPDPGPSIPPKVGSTFTYREFDIDSGGREVAGTTRLVTATVVSSDTTFAGRGRLTLFHEDDVRYFVHYDSSGDVFVLSSTRGFVGGGFQQWALSSRTAASYHFSDSLDLDGDSTRTFGSSSYEAASYTTTPAGRFNTHKFASYVFMRGPTGRALLDSSLDIVRWYAPALGVEVKHTLDVDGPGRPYDRKIRELVDYVLK